MNECVPNNGEVFSKVASALIAGIGRSWLLSKGTPQSFVQSAEGARKKPHISLANGKFPEDLLGGVQSDPNLLFRILPNSVCLGVYRTSAEPDPPTLTQSNFEDVQPPVTRARGHPELSYPIWAAKVGMFL